MMCSMEGDIKIDSINVRNLFDKTREALRIQAARHGRSVEAKVGVILDDAFSHRETIGLGSMLAAIGRDFGNVDLTIAWHTAEAEAAIPVIDPLSLQPEA